jgi:hypothetical protein
MMNAAQATDMAINGDVVGRIGKHEFRLGARKELIVGGLVAGIVAQQVMAVLAKLEIVEVPCGPGLPDEHQLVLGAVK